MLPIAGTRIKATLPINYLHAIDVIVSIRLGETCRQPDLNLLLARGWLPRLPSAETLGAQTLPTAPIEGASVVPVMSWAKKRYLQ